LPSPSPHSETTHQLEQLRQRVAQGNPQLYRHWALYLQVLRQDLATAVERACFHLAVEVHPTRYRALEPARRQELHRRISSLVRRSCTLLTVEQLQALAAQMRRQRRQQALRARRQWLNALRSSAAGEPEGLPGDAPPPVDVPQGSVHLGLAPPISAHLFGMAPQPESAASEEPAEAGGDNDDATASDLMAVFSSLLRDAEATELAEPQPQGSGPDRMMPDEPLQLLQWLESLDAALARRLRNLSHAVNVELVRLGLLTSLLPLRLLEAVAAGQVETQTAAANLVRLSIPLPDSPDGALIETRALLIRPADLESEQLRLRTCRTRLQQASVELRRMAQTYQRLERRLQIHDAEQLWLNDHSTAQTSRTPPPT